MEFQAWPKTPRLLRDVVVTEKIDGTNACVIVEPLGSDESDHHLAIAGYQHSETGEFWYQLGAQSRKRLLTLEQDNAGFARWVRENAETIANELGPGRHYGEWWGQGIQRGYGLTEKRFSLFNTAKWSTVEFTTPGLGVVPTIYEGEFNQAKIEACLVDLQWNGSHAAPGFDHPEGICVFHTQSRQVYKITLDGDGHKG